MPAISVLVGRVVGRLLDQLGVGGVRRRRGLRGDRGVLVDEELDRPGRVGEVVLARVDAERARPARDEVEAAVGHPLEHLGDLAGAADVAQPVVGDPHDPELALLLEHARDHRLVALLEDVQRDQLGRERHQSQREQRKVANQLHAH